MGMFRYIPFSNDAADGTETFSARRIFLRLTARVLSEAARYFLASDVSFAGMESTSLGFPASRKRWRVNLFSRLLRRSPESPRLKMEAKIKKAIGVLVLSTTENATGSLIPDSFIVRAFCMSRSRSRETLSVSTSMGNAFGFFVENGHSFSESFWMSSADGLMDMSGSETEGSVISEN